MDGDNLRVKQGMVSQLLRVSKFSFSSASGISYTIIVTVISSKRRQGWNDVAWTVMKSRYTPKHPNQAIWYVFVVTKANQCHCFFLELCKLRTWHAYGDAVILDDSFGSKKLGSWVVLDCDWTQLLLQQSIILQYRIKSESNPNRPMLYRYYENQQLSLTWPHICSVVLLFHSSSSLGWPSHPC